MILSKQEVRRGRINNIKQILIDYNGLLLKEEKKDLVMKCMSKWNCSERYANEIIKVAKFEYSHPKGDNFKVG